MAFHNTGRRFRIFGLVLALAGFAAFRTSAQLENSSADDAAVEKQLVGVWELSQGDNRILQIFSEDHSFVQISGQQIISFLSGKWHVASNALILDYNVTGRHTEPKFQITNGQTPELIIHPEADPEGIFKWSRFHDAVKINDDALCGE
jgi:hypothetical protein